MGERARFFTTEPHRGSSDYCMITCVNINCARPHVHTAGGSGGCEHGAGAGPGPVQAVTVAEPCDVS